MTASSLTSIFCLPVILAAAPSSFGQCPDERLELHSPSSSTYEQFGSAVGVAGTSGLFGVPSEDLVGMNSGSAYLLNTNTGQFIRKFVASDAAPQDQFGRALAMDGNLAIIGAPVRGGPGVWAGGAYLFDVQTGQQLFQLLPPFITAGEQFGGSVSISGATIAIGGLGDNANGAAAGAAYIFDAITGTQTFKLLASDGVASDGFGGSVAIDGNTLLVGAGGHDSAGSGAGAAYWFDATTGVELGKLVALDAQPDDAFGVRVGVAGSLGVVGAPGSDALGAQSGAAYVFDLNTGAQLHKLLPSDGVSNIHFGNAVQVYGTMALIGAEKTAYLFDLTTGVELRKLSRSDAQPSVDFGTSVALDAQTAIVGSATDDDLGYLSGSAYVYSIGTLGTNYCAVTANSSGFAAQVAACGSTSIVQNDFALLAQSVPNKMYLFFHGGTQVQVPFGDGFRCAGGAITRIATPLLASGNVARIQVNLASAGINGPGFRYFQCWFRDPQGAGAGFNLSDGLAVNFIP